MIIRALLALVSTRFILHQVAAYDAAPRWGQACVLVNEALFIHGGKVDQFNQYSYTSAPNTNDVLYLSLSNTFVASSPPWQLVSSSTNSSTSQGPALAWHTLSAFNNTEVLLFGGLPDANSKTVTFGQPDSGGLLDVYSRIAPKWITEPSSWGGEPIRRIRHSTVTTPNGLVFIFGGSKADGSQTALADHVYFDPSSLSFKPLPTTNAPPDLYGHVSVILPDGKIIVFGGFCSSKGSLLPFSTIWVFDPATNQWAIIITDTSSLPSPRLAFVAVCIQGGKIIIHGGSDAGFQTTFSDGWILDTTTNPWTWTTLDALTQLGPRRDHFAVSSGDNVVFGFGYANNGPAPFGVQVYNPSSSTWSPTYTPPASPSYTHTLPQASQTRNPTSPSGDQPSNPTSTGDDGHNGGNGNGSAADNDDDRKNRTTAIAVGTAFGILALVAVGLGAALVVRRRRRASEGDRRFMMLADDDFDEGGNLEGAQKAQHRIPAVRMHTEPVVQRQRGILGSLGFAGALGGGTGLPAVPRRDMLADEDAQSFGEWYNNQRRQGTGGSSWSLRSILGRTRSRNASAVSYGTGLPTPWREKSDPFSDGAPPMRDEETGFVGAAAVGMGGIAAASHIKRPSNRRDKSYQSYTSSRSAGSYRDPFADPLYEEERQTDTFDPAGLYRDYEDDEIEEHDIGRPTYDHGEGPEGPERERPPLRAPVRLVGNLAPIQTVLPLSQGGHALSPLSERSTPSQSTIHHFTTSGSSQGHANSDNNALSPFDSNSRRSIVSSLTSAEPTPPLPSPGSASTSIIGASAPSLLATNQPMRRSGSWWSRFARGGILDRRSSGASRRMGYDIRDPNPPPTLGAIEERSVISTSADKSSPHGSSPGSAGHEKMLQLQRKLTGQSTPPSASKAAVQLQEPTSGKTPPSRAGSMKVYGTGHGKSLSSIRTADSEAIERMVGAMDVVQRVQTRSQRGSGSMTSTGGLSLESEAPPSISEHGESNGGTEESHPKDDNLTMFMSPEEYTSRTSPPPFLAGPSHPMSSSPPSTSSSAASSRPQSDRGDSSGNIVADRIKAYERRMSLEIPTSPPATNTKQREERSGKKRVEVKYGLVPRQSLFIANPDKDRTGSGDS
ncbi:hypothetical protein CPB83DRAFT_846822 [Crepidotus variabilis]|uniref:Galactose oxidase n=1 Tax=Crepidotus variabilis TaxID=179855 RepID=A0A9P6JSX6_9AGAR|nr:hypothetical protein CPB83DRAFT_846822 [Crepidotus variabilis]